MPSTQTPPPEICLTQRLSHGDSALRLAFGAMAVIAALWLLAVDPRPVPRSFALAGLIFGSLWTWRFLGRQSAPAGENQLRLDAQTLTLRHKTTELVVPWRCVTRVELDHDALVVCVIRDDAPELRIDAGYGGLGVQALAELVQRHLTAWRVCTKPEHD